MQLSELTIHTVRCIHLGDVLYGVGEPEDLIDYIAETVDATYGDNNRSLITPDKLMESVRSYQQDRGVEDEHQAYLHDLVETLNNIHERNLEDFMHPIYIDMEN